MFRRYYFNQQTKRCEPFIYGGCEGNENRFETVAACQSRCGGPPDAAPEQDVTPIDICQLPADAGTCDDVLQRYHFNPQTKRCEPFIYGGCDGNENRFETASECQSRCGGPVPPLDGGAADAPPANICQLPADRGPCKGNETKYFFDTKSGSCLSFNYGGCLGNENRFDTLAQCEARCK